MSLYRDIHTFFLLEASMSLIPVPPPIETMASKLPFRLYTYHAPTPSRTYDWNMEAKNAS